MLTVFLYSSKSRCSEISFQGPVCCSGNSRVASAEINKHVAWTISIAAHCIVGNLGKH